MTRAAIERVGVCEQLDDGIWYLSGWHFKPTEPILGCPFVHNDDDTEHIGFLGWLYTDLRALSEASMALSMLEVADPGR